MRTLGSLVAALLVSSSLCGCTSKAPMPADPDADLPDPADSKADISGIFDTLKERLNGLVGEFSATTGDAQYASANTAIAHIDAELRAAGIADPSKAIFTAYVGRAVLEYFDHSELLLTGALGGGKQVNLHHRTVGDDRGAAVYDGSISVPLGPKLCLTHDNLVAAVRASYMPGLYMVDFVCHNITDRVLRAIDVAPEWYAPQIRAFRLAQWVFGPLFGSGLSQNPADWGPAQYCANIGQ